MYIIKNSEILYNLNNFIFNSKHQSIFLRNLIVLNKKLKK